MGKNEKVKKDKKDKKKDKHGKANMQAWEAARRVAKSIRKEYKNEDWSRLPWREIRDQLRRTGNSVDMAAVPVSWTNESSQMIKMRTILEEAGFTKVDDHLYLWEE